MRRLLKPLSLIAISASLLCSAMAQQRPRPPAQAAPVAPQPPPEPPPAVYEPQLLRLSEILGALTYLTELCRSDGPSLRPEAEGDAWRGKMRDLLEAEAQTPGQKERLAGAYNRGFLGYRTTYRTCTPSGKQALERLLVEGARLAHEISNRYGS